MRTGGPGTHRLDRRAQLAVVGDDEQTGDRAGSGDCPGLIDETDDQVVGRATTGVSNDQAGRDALAAEAGFRRAIEHELDPDRGWNHRAESTDQRGRRHPLAATGEGGQEIRTVDDQSIGVGQGIARRRHGRIVRARRAAATIGRVSLPP